MKPYKDTCLADFIVEWINDSTFEWCYFTSRVNIRDAVKIAKNQTDFRVIDKETGRILYQYEEGICDPDTGAYRHPVYPETSSQRHTVPCPEHNPPVMISGLDGDVLRQHGCAISTDGKHIRDADGNWWRMAWSYHAGRWESSVAHVDRVLRLAATGEKGNG